MLTAQLNGRVIHFQTSSYDFVDRSTGERVQGFTRIMWVLTGEEDSPPQGVKFRRDEANLFEQLKSTHKLGDVVSVAVVPGQRPRDDLHGYVQMLEAAKPGARAAS